MTIAFAVKSRHDVRRLAARGSLAPAALEQLALLVMLLDDRDLEIQAIAADTVKAIPQESLVAFLARSGGPAGVAGLLQGARD